MKMPVRVWARSEDKRFEWVTLTAKYLPGALSVMRNSFCTNESVSKVVGFAKSEKGKTQFESMLALIAEDGASIVAVEVDTDTVVGAAFNKFQVKGDPELNAFMGEQMEIPDIAPAFKEFLNFVLQMEAKVDIFEHYGITRILDHMFLATHQDYYQKGIGQGLVTATEDIARALSRGEDVTVPITEDKYRWKNIPPPKVEAVIALFTSPVPQKIGKSLGWDEILITKYDTLFYNGESYGSKLDKQNQSNAYMSIKFEN